MRNKLYLILMLSFFCYSLLHAQTFNNDLIVFTQDGEKFTLYLNGLRQNMEPESHVKIIGLNTNEYVVRAVFVNPKKKEHNDQLHFYQNNGKEITFAFVAKNKKEYTMELVSQIDLVPMENNTSKNKDEDIKEDKTYSKNTNTTTTNTNNTTNTNKDGVTFKTKDGDIKIGEDKKVATHIHVAGVDLNLKDKNINATVNGVGNGVSVNKSLEKKGCKDPMSAVDYETAKKTVTNQTSEENKAIAAKTAFENKCLTMTQIKDMMLVFSTDKEKLTFAKDCYDKTSDLSSYGDLKYYLTSDIYKEDFNRFLQSKK
ncbi:MAG: DUF4476 domain-containing protein [Cytophagaceae bacterium]|nr:DUF4476 domain-containing protein [Cytophagaceae bacterium]